MLAAKTCRAATVSTAEPRTDIFPRRSGSSANVKRFWWPQHPPLIGCVPTQWTMTELKPSRAKLRTPPFMYPSQ